MEIIAGIISLIILIYFIVKVGQIASNSSLQVDYLVKINEALNRSPESSANAFNSNEIELLPTPQQNAEIENLKALMDEGHISKEEFEEDKKKILYS